MDYSQLSDFEINKQVAICIHPDIKNWNCYDVSGRACFVINEGTPKRVQYGFSFTSDPADAWPIITVNLISLMHDESLGKWCAGKPYWVDGCEWQLDIDVMDENPLRAAMIFFLMMQDANHA
ncbi:phage protein NinX family protein [Enterobacter hormaechei]|uniref:phage protein NinX family protein n=1 Tax=Enterobacter hormaechei TaxID=158836 RepID=UPI003AAA8EA7